MRAGNTGSDGRSGAYDFSSADDFWKKLLDTPPPGVPVPAKKAAKVEPSSRPSRMLDEEEETVMGRPPQAAARPSAPPPQPPPKAASRRKRSSDFGALDTGVDLQQKIANAQQKSQGFVTGSFAPTRPIPLEKAAPDPWARGDRRLWWAAGGLMGMAVVVLTVFAAVTVGGLDPQSAVAAATGAAPASAVESPPSPAANTATPGWRPMIPTRARGAEPPAKPVVAKKHAKPRKGARHSL